MEGRGFCGDIGDVIARLIIALAVLGSHSHLLGQGRWHLYPDDAMVWREMVAHMDNGVLRMGNSWSGEVVYTLKADDMWDEVHVFQGFSTSSLDIAFTLRDGKLYLGDSAFSDAILYTFHEGQIFVGDSTFPLDVAYTIREERQQFAGGAQSAPLWGVYRDDSRSWSDRIAVVEGPLDAAAFFALLSAGGWL